MQKGATGRAWAILAAGAAIQIFTGVPAAWGVFNQPVTQEYGLSEGAAGWVFSLLIAAFGVGCVIGGFLQDRHGPRCAALVGHGAALRRDVRRSSPAIRSGRVVLGGVQPAGGLRHCVFIPGDPILCTKVVPGPQGACDGGHRRRSGSVRGFSYCFCPGDSGRHRAGAGHPGGVLGAGRSVSSGLSGGKPAAERPAPVREKAAGDRAGSWAGTDAPHPKLLALCGCGVLFYPGGAAVQPHYIAAVCAAGACGRRCFVGGGAGQCGQRGRTAADADAQ